MRQLIRWSTTAAAMLLLLALALAGVLASLDNRILDWRLGLNTVPASGDTVVIQIDSKSLGEIGVWPWPRSLYASLLDKLMDAGVDDVAFDIDFSSASEPFGDALFTAALEQAGGYAWLASFAQLQADGDVAFSRPLPQFAAAADPVLVNVLLDPLTGRAHGLPIAAMDGETAIPALAVALARLDRDLPDVLEVDFSIEMAGIPRFGFTDVLYGRVDPALLSGRQVIVGASAIELRDFFTVPRYGVVPGPVLQAMALETLKSGRILTNLGLLPGFLVTLALAAALLIYRHRLKMPVVVVLLVGVSIVGEALALFAYGAAHLIVSTASLHAGLLVLLGLALADNGYHHLLARRAAQERLRYLATHDPATGLLSRQGLVDLPAEAAPRMMIVLYVQAMDEMRATLGHELVERLLAQIAHRLLHSGFPEVARTAPAGFALADRDHGDSSRLAAAARQLIRTLSGSYSVDGNRLHVDIIAGYAAGETSRGDLLNRAETAVIQARAERVAVRGFDPGDQAVMDRHRRLDRDLRQALNRNQLHLVFQPQVDLKSREIVGAETLVRWNHPELGPISPVEFISLAEETGLIVDLGRWILWEACRLATLWPSPITVAVNISPIQFQHDGFVATIEAALRRSGLPAHRLELEITESERVADPAQVRADIRHLQTLGLRVSIDDFGTGYASLSYFRELPFETVKIDQSFVRGRTTQADLDLLAAMIRLSTSLEKLTIAEGVEDAACAARLEAMGCTYGQGYYFSPPISSEELSARLLEDPHRKWG
ncbi:putative bifunctional diguanylate cyclase/phosphodiesterase [Devosia sediminis]|uniref:EAL domain-containing protein n=1 Tax=Devosia sediminis TaxID=2798801 RepID=A0A934IX57_9HYPH|nr:EAL domain-containing protein [Devosia sediminis]MBJ3783554.1 EAL domain-containing protein [Devosia sediminis]